MQDVMETGVISAVISLKPWWENMLEKFQSCSSDEEKETIGKNQDDTCVSIFRWSFGVDILSVLVCSLADFSDRERDQMMQLANREFLFDDAAVVKSTYLGLVDILFGYAYNYRATGGENDVESPWNIARITSTFCWFDVSN